MDNLYYVENCGCDDTTHGLVRIPDEHFPKFKEFIENLNKNSTYGCMPKIYVYKANLDILRPATDEDDDSDKMYIGDAVYIYDKNVVYGERWKEQVI